MRVLLSWENASFESIDIVVLGYLPPPLNDITEIHPTVGTFPTHNSIQYHVISYILVGGRGRYESGLLFLMEGSIDYRASLYNYGPLNLALNGD